MISAEQKKVLTHYGTRVSSERKKFDMLDWGSREAQLARFKVFAGVIKGMRPIDSSPSGTQAISLLDAGCGFAELADFLRNQQLKVDYTGIDLLPDFIFAAAASQPEADLIIGDAFHEPPFQSNSFDLVFCSGALNLAAPAHAEFVRSALASMVSICRNCVVVNFLHIRTVDKYAHCHYYHPQEAMALLPTDIDITARVIDDYLENDFTLVAHKKAG